MSSQIWTSEMREKENRQHHESFIWTRLVTILLGIWLLVSPETFGYMHELSTYSDWICGALLIFFGILSMSYRFRWWIWGAVAVGVWLQFAPLLFWAKQPVVYLNQTIIGVIAIAVGILVPLRPKSLELGPEIPPGWTYNPSSWNQRIPVIFFAIVGWFIARYLASFQLHYISSVWDPFFGNGTEKVITSMISQEFPVPDAGLGAMAYSLEALMGVKGGTRRWHTMPWIVVIFGILVVPLGLVSIILVMLQPIAVGAWCGLCLLIAVCMLIMLALTVDEVVAVCQYLSRVRREGNKGKAFWKIFFGGSHYEEKGVDTRDPGFRSSFWKNLKAMVWGVTVPWNLLITAILGALILFLNRKIGFSGVLGDNADACSALIVVFSIISWAEVIRPVRFLNIPLAIWFAIAPFVLPGATSPNVKWYSIGIAILIIILSLFRGKIKERYGEWDKRIF